MNRNNKSPKPHPMERFIRKYEKKLSASAPERDGRDDYDYDDEKPRFGGKRKYSSSPSERSLSYTDAHPKYQDEERVKQFSDFVFENASKRGFGDLPVASASPFEKLDYKDELEIKLSAIHDFWRANALPGKISDIIPSVLPRNYRTTSKRKVSIRSGRVVFSLGYIPKSKPVSCVVSPLECPLHGELYASILELLNQKRFAALAGAMNYCIIRGNYDSAGVIVNLYKASGLIVHKLKLFTETLMEADKRVSGIFMFVDESRSEYYFEAFRPRTQVMFKKMAGVEFFDIRLDDERKLLYPPTAFSQVNGSMATVLASTAKSLLNPGARTRLVDLYCGYGLLSMYMAPQTGSIIGMDIEGPAVRAANMNAEHLCPKSSVKYIAKAVTPESLERFLPSERKTEFVILDPPRSGTADGVIETLTARHPKKVLHIFCGTDKIPEELRIWVSNGYKVAAVKVLDMFPGTPNIETMILLEARDKDAEE